ncbi:MAG TPA: GNAT family N-acetyltransferase [Thermoanaerobaculia bacterium]|nr:GNAT family N-acetyltransferase [Thermoanaerobaculia bacterium]
MTNDTHLLTTERLNLRRLSLDDSAFIIELLNQPSFLRFIGDRGVRTEADAHRYLLNGPLDSYARLGFGLYVVELKEERTRIGICGLLKRETLVDVDLGFAFLPDYWSKGYAVESAKVVLRHGRNDFGLCRVVAITSPANVASIAVLKKLGFVFESVIRLSGDGEEVNLFAADI